MRREHVDDAIDGRDGAVRVERGEDEVPVSLMVSAASMVSKSRSSPMSTHVGVLPEHVAVRALEPLGVGAHFALVDHRELVRVQVLDRVFDGEDVQALLGLILSSIAASVVDLPSRSGRSPAPGPRLGGEVGQNRGQAELLEGEDLEGDRAERPATAPRCM